MLYLPVAAAAIALSRMGFVLAEPQMTAAAQLIPRATDPSFVGYISATNGYGNARTCDYPQTVSTSGNYVQCCAATGTCAFYTSCSSNTLLGAGVTVACDISTALTCNTGIVETTVGASGGASYLACWQKTLGSSAFTFVQDIGTATAVASTASTSAAASGNTASSSLPGSEASQITSSASQSASSASSGSSASAASMSSSSSKAAAVPAGNARLNGGILGGAMALLAQLML